MIQAFQLDPIDRNLLGALLEDARVSHVDLAEKVGLSPTACARRIRRLEEEGVLKGYRAELDTQRMGVGTVVVVRITLRDQTEELFTKFESAVKDCPEVFSCFLMSGSDDYLLMVAVEDIAEYERLHMKVLSRLPGVHRIHSSFTLRPVVQRHAAASRLGRKERKKG
jgi:Lrp/AsnC family transcriptional regulator, leucine-responsive regulatory protein